MPYMTHSYGNPHSRTHMYGWESEEAVETARQVFHFKYNFNQLIFDYNFDNILSIYQT